ncbi:malto-oligosyltrehalose synthase [Propionibacteriaceae bacterium Y1700]|uniref:malto-oligosyltrehalose synthase n=1 Tax=Microlunatus sp. Y1700 TaxID=3418487 RepID=UPI003DA75EEF
MAPPTSTYRLQIRAGLTLSDAAALCPQLADLGVGAIYCSPVLRSTEGSDHGYDVTDPTMIDPARGGEEGWAELVAAAREHGLGLVVDIVPNHLGVEAPAENPSWWSVLREGQQSAYASWYDIDWSFPITLPVLGDDFDHDQLSIDTEAGELRYFEHRFPLAAGSWAPGDGAATVHERQHYRLINWQEANERLSYRRFFAVNGLAGLRVEDEQVFTATNERVLRWIADGEVIGIRVDHPDGLVDPGGYLQQLADAAPETWLVAEKILEPGEALPTGWPIAGTTGYDAMTELTQVLVDPSAEQALTDTYRELTGDDDDVPTHVRRAKDMVCRTLFGAEFARILRLVPEVVEAHGEQATHDALRELAVAFDVYRSYLPDGAEHLDAALDRVRVDHGQLAPVLEALSPRLHDGDDEVARRFQQLTGPAMAKGLEDTAWYRHARLIALNEVGGDPGRFGMMTAEFHQAWQQRAAEQPDSMLSLSTHDTKRGEDVRARIACLSELPLAWHHAAENFLAEAGVPDPRFGYFLAQTLVGVGFAERERLHAYAEKAMREAAEHTTWDDPDETYEQAVHVAIDRAYDDPSVHGILDKVHALVEQPGWSNALSQKLMQLTGPGVPDVYQGTELWEDSLVDPDNRREVDFASRATLPQSVAQCPPVDDTGTAKWWVTRHALRLRRDRPELFTGYAPLLATGNAAEHLVAFDRGGAITLATRLPITLAESGGWGSTTVRLDGTYTDVLTGSSHRGNVPVSEILHRLPVALLTRDE